jgi:hypothetical protein
MLSERLKIVLVVILTAAFSWKSVEAQTRDAGLWLSATVQAKLSKKLSASLSEELRLNENMSEAGTIFTDAGLEYRLIKNLGLAVNYRFINKKAVSDYYKMSHRFYADVKYSFKIKPVEISLRSRVQDELKAPGRSDDGGSMEYYLRNKATITVDLNKKIEPFASAELFNPLQTPLFQYADKLRTTVGADYALTKHHKAELFYMIQSTLGTADKETDFIIGLSYVYKFSMAKTK